MSLSHTRILRKVGPRVTTLKRHARRVRCFNAMLRMRLLWRKCFHGIDSLLPVVKGGTYGVSDTELQASKNSRR